MAELQIDTPRRSEMIDITMRVNGLIPAALKSGICHLFCPHTTAALTINENADPDVKHDLLTKLEQIIPHTESFYRHQEGNSDAHLKAALIGFSLAIPVKNGKLSLGTWQGVYFCEFDGPRQRKIQVYWQTAEA